MVWPPRVVTLLMERMRKLLWIGLLVGCAPSAVYPAVLGGSKADGTVELSYTYKRKHTVDWDAAHADAIRRCQMWGYESAEFFPAGRQTCLRVEPQYGYCQESRVDTTAQCIGGDS